MSTDAGSLSGLHDIVAAPPPGWWPLAPGWYLLAVAILVLGALWAYRYWQRYQADRYRRAALAELNQIEQADEPDAIYALPALLKRTAMQAWSREEVAALNQAAWCQFLDRHCPGKPFAGEVGELLLSLSYRPGQIELNQQQRLIESARVWIRRHRMEAC